MKSKIAAISSYVPQRVVSNDEISEWVDTTDEWIRSHTGIRERRIVAQGEAASDLARVAGERALSAAGIGADAIDAVILACSTTDYPNFPATASIVQDRLGCENAAAFDISAGCTGFVYGLEIARSMVEAGGFSTVLLIGAEALTTITNWNDRNTCVLFGDGAGAAIITTDPSASGPTVVRSWLRSQGSGDTALMRRAGGSRDPYDPKRHTTADFQIAMDGKRVYLFAVDAVVQTIRRLCELEGIEPEQLDHIVPHQANLRIIEAAAKRLKLPITRFFTNLDRYANTSAASIPIALDEMLRDEHIRSGERVLTVGFGAGLTYGGNIIRF